MVDTTALYKRIINGRGEYFDTLKTMLSRSFTSENLK